MRKWLTSWGLWRLKKRPAERARESMPTSSVSAFYLSENVALSSTPGDVEREVGRKRLQKQTHSRPSGATDTSGLRLSLNLPLPQSPPPRDKQGQGKRVRGVRPGDLEQTIEKTRCFSAWLSNTCPFKGCKTSQALDSLTRPLRPINYTTW